jgi:hypothetical protein
LGANGYWTCWVCANENWALGYANGCWPFDEYGVPMKIGFLVPMWIGLAGYVPMKTRLLGVNVS